MSRRRTAFLLVLALLTTFALGCGLLDGLTQKASEKGAEIVEQGKAAVEAAATEAVAAQPEPTKPPEAVAEPTEEPTDAPEATEAPSADTVDLSSVADFETLDSYRLNVTISWKKTPKEGAVEEGTMEMLEEFDRASSSRRFKMSGMWPGDVGLAAESGEMEMIQIGNASYIGSDGEWMSMQSSEDEAQDQIGWSFDPSDFASGEGTYVGTENVNGVSAKRYHYEERGGGSLGLGFGAIDEADSDVWVSVEHNVVVKVATTWQGTDTDGTEYAGSLDLNVTDINQPVVIEAPEGVEPPGMPEDVPLMDGATNVQSMAGINTYDTSASLDDVIAFYDEEMPANGWTAGDDSIPGMRQYTKGGRQAMLMVEEKDAGCSVTLMVAEE